MNTQPQDAWIATEEQTDSVRFTKGFNGDFTLGREYLEKRSGVIILTKDELDKIRRNDYAAGVDWALNTGQKFGEQYEKYLGEYLSEPI